MPVPGFRAKTVENRNVMLSNAWTQLIVHTWRAVAVLYESCQGALTGAQRLSQDSFALYDWFEGGEYECGRATSHCGTRGVVERNHDAAFIKHAMSSLASSPMPFSSTLDTISF